MVLWLTFGVDEAHVEEALELFQTQGFDLRWEVSSNDDELYSDKSKGFTREMAWRVKRPLAKTSVFTLGSSRTLPRLPGEAMSIDYVRRDRRAIA